MKRAWCLIIPMMAAVCFLPRHTPGQIEFVSGYNPDSRCVVFDTSMQAPDGTLKNFDAMTDRQIATIYYEMWHAWFIEVEAKRRGDLFKAMEKRAETLHQAYPESKRMEFYREAVAGFIDTIIETYMQTKRFLTPKTPERREEIRTKTRFFQNTYVEQFYKSYNGFYTKSITLPSRASDTPTSFPLRGEIEETVYHTRDAEKVFGGFIQKAGRFSLPVTYIREAVKSIDGVVFMDFYSKDGIPSLADVVFANAYLTKEDLDRVIGTVFEGKLTRDPNVAFAEDRFQVSVLKKERKK